MKAVSGQWKNSNIRVYVSKDHYDVLCFEYVMYQKNCIHKRTLGGAKNFNQILSVFINKTVSSNHHDKQRLNKIFYPLAGSYRENCFLQNPHWKSFSWLCPIMWVLNSISFGNLILQTLHIKSLPPVSATMYSFKSVYSSICLWQSETLAFLWQSDSGIRSEFSWHDTFSDGTFLTCCSISSSSLAEKFSISSRISVFILILKKRKKNEWIIAQ